MIVVVFLRDGFFCFFLAHPLLATYFCSRSCVEVLLGLKSLQGEITCALLHADLEENKKVYVDMPAGFSQYGKNGNTFWADAIAKEMKEVRIAFNILPDGHVAPNGYQKIPCHMVFDIKMEDFRRKARLVAGGHMTGAPATITYASVVSRETVRLALTIAALNDLEVKVAI